MPQVAIRYESLPLMLVKINKLNLKMELVQDPKNKKDERQRPFGSKREKSKTVNSLRIICSTNLKVYQCRFNHYNLWDKLLGFFYL